jgi:hypothetical protein
MKMVAAAREAISNSTKLPKCSTAIQVVRQTRKKDNQQESLSMNPSITAATLYSDSSQLENPKERWNHSAMEVQNGKTEKTRRAL